MFPGLPFALAAALPSPQATSPPAAEAIEEYQEALRPDEANASGDGYP